MARMTDAQKIVAILKSHGIPWHGAAEIRRTRAGRNQRAAGAWSWSLAGDESCNPSVGSQTPVRELLRGEVEVTFNKGTHSYEIDPFTRGQKDRFGRVRDRTDSGLSRLHTRLGKRVKIY